MDDPRWWHVATAAMAVLITVMVLASEVAVWREVGALASLAVFTAAWFAIGPRAMRHRGAGIVFSVLIVVSVGVAIAFLPIMAMMQTVAFPLLWVLAPSLRDAIVANVALASAVAIGFWSSTGNLAETALTAGLSLGFSLALGIWITQIAERSEERQRLLTELRATQDRLAAVSRDAGAASERERLAREIHDTIAQDLTGLVMLAQQARRELGDPDRVAERLGLIEQNAREALAETRSLVAAGAPVELDSGGLLDALQRLAARFERESGIAVGIEGDAPPLSREAQVVLLRCAQESLANVRKHSGASSVRLVLTEADGAARLEVRDDGHGFDPQTPSIGFGLGGMRDRLALVGGRLDVSTSPSGTVLAATLPAGGAA